MSSGWRTLLYHWLLAGLFILFGSLDIVAQKAEQGFTSEQKDSVRAFVSSFPKGVQLAVGLVDDNSTSFYGVRKEKDGVKAIANADSVFRIASLSKVFTSRILAEFVHQGRIGLKDTIWGPLGIEPKLDTPITFEHLASHTSGLPKIPANLNRSSNFALKNPYKGYGPDKLEKYIRKEMRLKSAPGGSYAYSNLGYGILARSLTKLADSSYEALLQEHIAGPLGMERTTVKLDKVANKAVQGKDLNGQATPYWDFGALKGAGAIFSTARDLAHFARANFDSSDAVTGLQQTAVHRANKGMDLALGWHILKGQKEGRWYWHNGGSGGFRSSLVLDRDARKAVVVLVNISVAHKQARKLDGLSFNLLRTLL